MSRPSWRVAWLSLVVLGVLSDCSSARPVPDAGDMNEVEFEGEAASNIPDFVPGIIDAGDVVDAGEATIDSTCCDLAFFLPSAGEPADATGTVVGEVIPLVPGVALTRVDGGFAATACFFQSNSSFYDYQLEWPTSDADAGSELLIDGGYLVRVHRHSPNGKIYPMGDGTYKNFIPSVTSCSQHTGP